MNKIKEQWLKEALKYYKEEFYEKALKSCECAIRIDPTFARAFHGKALILMHQKKYKKALASYDIVCKLDEKNAKAYSERGALLYELENFKLARESYQVAMLLDKKYEEVYKTKTQDLINKAREIYKQNGIIKSIDAMENILSFDPNNDFAKSTLVELQKELKEKMKKVELNRHHFSNLKLSAYSHAADCRCKDCYSY